MSDPIFKVGDKPTYTWNGDEVRVEELGRTAPGLQWIYRVSGAGKRCETHWVKDIMLCRTGKRAKTKVT